jgi:hypothetical protein
MKEDLWNIWLLNKGRKPSLYFADMKKDECFLCLRLAARKVFDGSDADAFIMLRSDLKPEDVWG